MLVRHAMNSDGSLVEVGASATIITRFFILVVTNVSIFVGILIDFLSNLIVVSRLDYLFRFLTIVFNDFGSLLDIVFISGPVVNEVVSCGVTFLT